jgi:hypothetical protein
MKEPANLFEIIYDPVPIQILIIYTFLYSMINVVFNYDVSMIKEIH